MIMCKRTLCLKDNAKVAKKLQMSKCYGSFFAIFSKF